MPAKKVKVKEVEAQVCSLCVEHPGLDSNSAQAQACPGCDGSPTGAPAAEVTVEVEPEAEVEKEASDDQAA
jgi:hypothetical protein